MKNTEEGAPVDLFVAAGIQDEGEEMRGRTKVSSPETTNRGEIGARAGGRRRWRRRGGGSRAGGGGREGVRISPEPLLVAGGWGGEGEAAVGRCGRGGWGGEGEASAFYN
jgi:hypothetical protein